MAGTPAAEVAVTPEQVCGLLADQHPQFSVMPISFAGEGWDNFTFRLGNVLAVRMPRRQAAAPLLINEQMALPRIAPGLPLPVPAPIAIGAPGRGFPWPWSVIPWIEGEVADRAPLDAEQGPALARFLRALHRPAPDDAPENDFRGVPIAPRDERIRELFSRLSATSDIITPALERAWREAVAAPVFEGHVWLHGDIHAQNVLTRDGRLASIIDWGDMCSGDPAVDLCSVWGVLGHASARAQVLAEYAPDDALLARARGWAILFGSSLYENGLVDDPRHAAIGEATLRRLAQDLA